MCVATTWSWICNKRHRHHTAHAIHILQLKASALKSPIHIQQLFKCWPWVLTQGGSITLTFLLTLWWGWSLQENWQFPPMNPLLYHSCFYLKSFSSPSWSAAWQNTYGFMLGWFWHSSLITLDRQLIMQSTV